MENGSVPISKGLAIDLVPVPRQFSSNCGICLRIEWEQRERVCSLLEEGGVKIEEVHILTEKGN